MRRAVLILIVLGAAAGWWLTRPATIDGAMLDGLTADATRGETVFHAAGCASCHSAPDTTGDAKLVLAGGRGFPSDFGTFFAPNISPDATAGIGGWTAEDLANAMLHGTSPDGQHYYPAFPYTSYTRTMPQDIVDLKAYLDTLPADATPNRPHEVGFPFSIRRSLGGWKLLFLDDGWVMEAADDPQLERGRYLVEALGHCGECHTPRGLLGNLQTDAWMTGAPEPVGDGKVPGVTPAQLGWGANEIAYYLETGFTPEFDSVGGHMVDVVENFGKLTAADRGAVAAYLLALPDS